MQRLELKFVDSIGDVIWRFFVLDGAALADLLVYKQTGVRSI